MLFEITDWESIKTYCLIIAPLYCSRKKWNLEKNQKWLVVPVILSGMNNSFLFQLNDLLYLLNENYCLILSAQINL